MKKLMLLFLSLAVFVVAGCEGAQDAAPVAKEEGPPKVREWKDDEIVYKYNDEQITYGTFKRWWSKMSGNRAPEEFDKLDDPKKFRNINSMGVTHLLAKKARKENVTDDPLYKALRYELISRKMPEVYAQAVIVKENPLPDEELITMIPPAIPEVSVRVLVRKNLEAARKGYERLKNGDDMEVMVRLESEGLSKDLGGLSKWLNVNRTMQYPLPVIQRFLDAEEGTLLEPFYQDIGFLVVRIEGQRSAKDVQNLWLDANRDQFKQKKRQEAYRAKIAELSEDIQDISWEEKKIKLIGLEGGPANDEVLVRVRDLEFSFDVIADKAMLQAGHTGDSMFNHLKKFIERAIVTEEALRLGLMEEVDFMEEVETISKMHLADVYKKNYVKSEGEREVTQEDLIKYYETHPSDFIEPDKYCLSLIELDAEDKAQLAQERLTAGEDFATLASELSIGSGKEDGGNIGCFYGEQVPRPILEAITGFGVGDITTSPVHVTLTDGGDRWLLIKADDVSKSATVPFDRVITPIIEGRIQTQRRSKAMEKLMLEASTEFGYENCFYEEYVERSGLNND